MTYSITGTQPIVAAYFPEWGIYGRDYQIADIPADQLTHLIYAFAKIDSSGRMSMFDGYAATEKRFTDATDAVGGTADSYYYPAGDPRANQTVFGNFNQIIELKALHPALRTNIAIGGWTLSGNFSTTLDTAAERAVFTDSVISFLKTNQMFDGVDFDWEYPGGGGLDANSSSSQDGVNYAETLKLLRSKLDELGQEGGRYYEISVASPAGIDKIPGMNLAELSKYVDFFNLMAYDFHGTWEAFTGHQSALTGDPIGYDITTAVEAYLSAGVAAGKIVLGSPMYTRAWSGVQSSPDDYGVADFGYNDAGGGAAPGSFEKGVYDYKDLLNQYRTGGWQLIWDDKAQAAYLWNPTEKIYSSFETPATVALKSAWAREQGLGGIMFWDLSNDATGDQESLVKAGADYWLEGKSFAEIAAASGLVFDHIIGGNGSFDLAQVLSDLDLNQGTLQPSTEPLMPVPTPLAPDPTPVAPGPGPAPSPQPVLVASGITAKINLSGQWSGTFEGQVVVTNHGSSVESQWSTSFISRYQLRAVSDFTLTQTQLGDGTWQVTLKPPSWGLSLAAGASASSYVQGLIPTGSAVSAADLIMGETTLPPLITPAVPSPPDPIVIHGGGETGSMGDPVVDPITNPMSASVINIGGATTRLLASQAVAETFRLSYAWGRILTIEGFDCQHDVVDLRGFWGEANGAHAIASSGGALIDLGFNAQQIQLAGVEISQMGSGTILI